MIIGVAIAVAPVLGLSRSEERRTLNRAYAVGEITVPSDASIRIAAVAKPEVSQAQIDEAFTTSHTPEGGPLFSGASVHRETGESEILITLPSGVVETRQGLVREIKQYLGGTGLFEEVRVVEASDVPALAHTARIRRRQRAGVVPS